MNMKKNNNLTYVLSISVLAQTVYKAGRFIVLLFILFYFPLKLQDAQNTNICSVGLRGRSPLFVEALFTFPFSNGALRRRGHTV